MLTYHLMTEQEKELASSWRYKGEYAIYNEPSYQEQKEKGIGFGNPARDKNFYAIRISIWRGSSTGPDNLLSTRSTWYSGFSDPATRSGQQARKSRQQS